jgi:hypothetical protein
MSGETKKIPEKEMMEIIVVAMNMESMKILCEVPIKDRAALTELGVSGKSPGMEGALVCCRRIPA